MRRDSVCKQFGFSHFGPRTFGFREGTIQTTAKLRFYLSFALRSCFSVVRVLSTALNCSHVRVFQVRQSQSQLAMLACLKFVDGRGENCDGKWFDDTVDSEGNVSASGRRQEFESEGCSVKVPSHPLIVLLRVLISSFYNIEGFADVLACGEAVFLPAHTASNSCVRKDLYSGNAPSARRSERRR